MGKRRAKGEGSLFFNEKEAYWTAEVVLPDGRRKRKRSKKQSVVKAWLLAQRNALKDGLPATDDRLTVSSFFDRYFNDVAVHTLRPRTQEEYESLIRRHIKPAIGHLKLTQLRPDHLQNLYSEKLKSGLSSRTVQFIHSVIHKALEHAVKWGLVARNVSDLVDRPKVQKKPHKIWSVEQVKVFLDAASTHRFYPIYVLACATGMREGELLGIHYEDVDWVNGTIHVRHTVSAPKGGLVISEPKTDMAKRPIPLPEYAREVLWLYVNQQNINQGLLFSTRSGKPISPRNLIRHFKSVIIETGLPDIRFHDLRHYHASYLLAQNVNPKVVQERLGHSSIVLTLDTYSHVIPTLQQEAAQKTNEMFK